MFIYEIVRGMPPFKREDVGSKLRFKRIVKEGEAGGRWVKELGEEIGGLVGGLLRFEPEKRVGMGGFKEIKGH